MAQQMHNPDSDVGNVMQNTAFTEAPSAQRRIVPVIPPW